MLSGKETNEMKRTFLLPLLLLCSCASHSPLPVAYDNTETVNIGYGSYSRKEVSTSVTKVDSKDVDNASMSNIFDYLEGRVPGLQITRTGENTAIVNIRGSVSFYGDTQPLFVVDGMVVEDISDINPREVRSVEVLKDGGAAIYGSRGANGVILITMKNAGN